MYKFVIKSGKCKLKVINLEKYVLLYYLENECDLLANLQNIWYRIVSLKIICYQALSKLQKNKKDDLSKADIDKIIRLYC